jgi:hypothetical protein
MFFYHCMEHLDMVFSDDQARFNSLPYLGICMVRDLGGCLCPLEPLRHIYLLPVSRTMINRPTNGKVYIARKARAKPLTMTIQRTTVKRGILFKGGKKERERKRFQHPHKARTVILIRYLLVHSYCQGSRSSFVVQLIGQELSKWPIH